MAGIYGLLGLADGDRTYTNVIGQERLFTVANQFLDLHTADMMRMTSVFIESETESYSERYKLPGGGRLQKRGGQAQSGAVKASGSWDVAYPLEDFGAQVAGDDVSMAYLRVDELNTHLQTVTIQDMNTVRFEILKALFHNAARTFVDPLNGSLTLRPLAIGSGDNVLYPPVLGSETEATENHYLGISYAGTAISNTNNPYITIRGELEEHFGTPEGFGNVAVFIHTDEVNETELLGDFEPIPSTGVSYGDDVNLATAPPRNLPGRVIGRVSGVWVVEWRWIPSGYLLGVDLDQPAPLKMRRDPADTGLQRGLHLKSRDAKYPFESAHYRHRFGVAVGNRLNGVVAQLGTATYDIPTAYE